MTRFRALVLAVSAAAVATLAAAGTPATAAAAPASASRPGHVLTPLPGCLVTLQSKVSDPGSRTCLTPAPAGAPAAASPNAFTCAFDYYQNGPYGSAAWANGWGACAIVTGPSNYYVPRSLNDQASSWDSCASGIFYTNQPGTAPSAGFPAGSHGNFPWGAVANDALSSARVNYACTA